MRQDFRSNAWPPLSLAPKTPWWHLGRRLRVAWRRRSRRRRKVSDPSLRIEHMPMIGARWGEVCAREGAACRMDFDQLRRDAVRMGIPRAIELADLRAEQRDKEGRRLICCVCKCGGTAAL